MTLNRRTFLNLLGVSTGAIAAQMTFPQPAWSVPPGNESVAQPSAEPVPEPPPRFVLPPLPYAYNALEPYIDERTMRFHHDQHHAAYVKNLNSAIAKYPNLKDKSIEDLLRGLSRLPEDIRATVRNNGGGHLNHSLFWESMAPKAGGEPTGALAEAINQRFGTFADFQQQFNNAGIKRFGSGWVWLVRDRLGKLQIITTPNQDSPIMVNNTPLLGNDVWEHAYYLLYQNRRADYLNAWWHVVNWEVVGDRYRKTLA